MGDFSGELHGFSSLLSYYNRALSMSSSSSSSSSSRSSSSSCSSSSCSSSSSSSSCRSSSSSCRSSSSSSRNACWVAAEIFDGWYAPKTVQARYYVLNIAPSWFREFYIKNGVQIADFIHNKPILKAILRPMFEIFSYIGGKRK